MNRTARVEQTEICIIGTGAAGGILAYRLAMAGRDVLSLEQGADICDDYFTNGVPPEQAEHFGIAPDRPWPPPPGDAYLHVNAQASRLYARADTMSTTPDSAAAFVNLQIFRLNGKQNVWGGASLRQSPRDFRARDFGDGDVNWPIGYDDLDRHYTEVERLIGVCGTREGLDELPDGEFLPPMPLRPIDEFFRQSLTRVRGARIRAIPHRKAIETRPDAPNVCPQCGYCIHGCRTKNLQVFEPAASEDSRPEELSNPVRDQGRRAAPGGRIEPGRSGRMSRHPHARAVRNQGRSLRGRGRRAGIRTIAAQFAQ